jgi:hypothetical protein
MEAESTALAWCRAADAKIVVRGRNVWLALAVDDRGAWGSAWASGRYMAEQLALKQCSAAATSTCRVLTVFYAGG